LKRNSLGTDEGYREMLAAARMSPKRKTDQQLNIARPPLLRGIASSRALPQQPLPRRNLCRRDRDARAKFSKPGFA